MRRIREYEAWSVAGRLLPAEYGKEVLQQELRAEGIPREIFLGLSKIPSPIDIENLKRAIDAGELTQDAFMAFCEAHHLQPDMRSAESAAKFLEYSEGRCLAWIHIPDEAPSTLLKKITQTLEKKGHIVVDSGTGKRLTDPASSERTLSLAIIADHLPAVEQTILSTLSRIGKNEFHHFTAPLDIYNIYLKCPPAGGAHPFKLVIYLPRNCTQSTVFVSNRADGWNSFCYIMAEQHKKFQIQVTSTSNHAKFPKHMIQVWDNGRSSRIVLAIRDSDEWKFSERGEVQSFEEEALYSRKFIKERMNREIIVSYLKKLGYDIHSSEFWESVGSAVYFSEEKKAE